MKLEFLSAVPEIPVSHIEKTAAYYETKLGFRLDWVAKNSRMHDYAPRKRQSPPRSRPSALRRPARGLDAELRGV